MGELQSTLGRAGESKGDTVEKLSSSWNFSFGWGVLALVGLVAAWVWVPSFLLLLSFLAIIIVTHEWGHYFVAKKSGIRPTEAFWGFGPEVFGITRNGCRYGVKAIFLGGYVKLEGMSPTSELPEGFPELDSYRAASHSKRLATIMAGPFVNIAGSLLAYFVAAVLSGYTIVESWRVAYSSVWFVSKATAITLGSLFVNFTSYVGDAFSQGDPSTPFMSPISQAEVSQMVVESGLASSLQWFAILSCSIGFLNLLPLPPLDGSHAVLVVLERGIQFFQRGDKRCQLDVRKLVPLAYVTLGALVFISCTALIVDLRTFYL